MPRREVVVHDYANMFILPLVGGMCMASYFQLIPHSIPMWTMLIYIVFDFGTQMGLDRLQGTEATITKHTHLHPHTAWIATIPSCVPKASLILVHHVFTAVLLLVALRYIERFGKYGAMDGMVELNTFFLVARRSLPVKSLQPLCNVLYWATYPMFRLFMYVDVSGC